MRGSMYFKFPFYRQQCAFSKPAFFHYIYVFNDTAYNPAYLYKTQPFPTALQLLLDTLSQADVFYQDKSVAHDTSEQRHAVLLQPGLYQKFFKTVP